MLKVQIFRGKASAYPGGRRRWYVRLIAKNGEILSVSQGYATKWNAKRAAKKNFPRARLEIVDS